jgi:valyl-tRNA synthetase
VGGAAAFVRGGILRLLQPAIPFVTEELWDYFGYGEAYSLIRAPWPEPVEAAEPDSARATVEKVVRVISEIRSVRSEMNMPPSVEIPVRWVEQESGWMPILLEAYWQDQIRRLGRVSDMAPLQGAIPRGSAQIVLDEALLVLPLEGVVDVPKERARLQRELERAQTEADKLVAKISNEDFRRRAPEEVVEENEARMRAALDEVARLVAALARIE